MTQENVYVLDAEIREGKRKGVTRKLRAKDVIPAVLYGGEKEPSLLQIDRKEFERLLHKIAGESVLVSLRIKGTKQEEQIFIKEAQRHPITDTLIHADFYRVSMAKKLRVEVPIHAVGTPIGVKQGGILETLTRSIEIKCLPGKIPHHMEADISNLDINHSIHIRDLTIDPEIEVLTPKDTALFTIVPPKIEEVVAAPEAVEGEEKPEGEEPEVIGKGKAAKEEEEGEK